MSVIRKGPTPRSRYRPRSKYGAIPTVVDGRRFHSKKEARRYSELRLLEKAGHIKGLCLQPEYPLLVPTHGDDPVTLKGVGVYRADFEYEENGRHVVEDAKGVRTPVYRLKKRMVEAIYGFKIRET